MRVYFDTEFFEDGHTIDLMSIGMVNDRGDELYMINSECDWRRPFADPWHQANTLPTLFAGGRAPVFGTREDIAHAVRSVADPSPSYLGPPEFWAWYADYDWVVLCQLFGRMVDLPGSWPKYCNDLRQLAGNEPLVRQSMAVHNALADARWVRDRHQELLALARTAVTRT